MNRSELIDFAKAMLSDIPQEIVPREMEALAKKSIAHMEGVHVKIELGKHESSYPSYMLPNLKIMPREPLLLFIEFKDEAFNFARIYNDILYSLKLTLRIKKNVGEFKKIYTTLEAPNLFMNSYKLPVSIEMGVLGKVVDSEDICQMG